VLGPLAPADPARFSIESAQTGEYAELRHTLHTLLAHHGQRGPAAAELGVHRNTLRDRIHRIERLTGRSLEQPDDRAELWLALRLGEAGS
ncbi:MAG: helix-turn-helix domain-containing protein, partial [Actinobacteria bacterium]|nr:helix-turn-helix domain-containing protein [Actinomycetota bacterium]